MEKYVRCSEKIQVRKHIHTVLSDWNSKNTKKNNIKIPPCSFLDSGSMCECKTPCLAYKIAKKEKIAQEQDALVELVKSVLIIEPSE